jgi:hydrogenase maturation protein HypF
VRDPRRSALGVLSALGAPVEGPGLGYDARSLRVLVRMLETGTGCVATTSAGRLFDAVAALLGLCDVMSFEGQAAAALQAAAEAAPTPAPYPLPLRETASGLVADWVPLLGALLAERAAGVPVALSAGRFHAALAALVVAVARRVSAKQVVLAGGCFQNRHLLALTGQALEAAGIAVWWPQRLPPGDGALAVGQAAVARARFEAMLKNSVPGIFQLAPRGARPRGAP